jgi:hypothetical protein
MATTEDAIIERAPANIARLGAQAAEHKAVADAIDAENTVHIGQINDAEDQLDRLDDKIRLLDRERDAAADAREADADAEALEMQGDPDAAAARRADAARFRAVAEQAARDGAAIGVDNQVLVAAGIDVPSDFEVTATATLDAAPVDPASAADELSARAAATADQAAQLRQDLLDQTQEKMTEIDIARDRAARAQYGAEQSAKSADIQVAREQRAAEESSKLAADTNAQAEAAATRGDALAAEELRETASSHAAAAVVHSDRARQAELDAAELRAQAEQHGQQVVELEAQHEDLRAAGSAAGTELDKMEDQARLFDEAARKMAEAANLRAGGATDDATIATIGRLEDEAEKVLEAAAKIDVDAGKITDVLPDAEVDASTPSSEVTPPDDADPLGLRIDTIEPSSIAEDATDADTDTDVTTDTPTDTDDTAWLADYVEDAAPADAGADVELPDLTAADDAADDFAMTEDGSAGLDDDASFDDLADFAE